LIPIIQLSQFLNGQKMGVKTGNPRGRPRGTKNKATVIRETGHAQLVEQAKAEGITPLEHMLKVLRDPGADERRRDAMAVAAAPFVHPKLSQVEANITANIKRDADEYTDDELAAIAAAGGTDHVATAGGPKVTN
jgi:hypothetical protein